MRLGDWEIKDSQSPNLPISNYNSMKREDYLMRLIEAFAQQLGKMLAQVLDLVDAGHYAEAHGAIDLATRELSSLSTDGIVEMSDEALLVMLQMERRTDWAERAAYLSFLLREDGRIYMQQADETAGVRRFLKALHLQLAVIPEKEQTVITEEDIEVLLADLEEYELPGRTYAALMTHYERGNRFGKAEDILYDWLGAESVLADLNMYNPVEFGAAFYGRLLQLDDTVLKRSNLSREEVEAGLEELLSDE